MGGKMTRMMKSKQAALRSRLAVILSVALPVCGGLRPQDKDFSKVEIKVTKVSGNIYMLEGEGGNIAASLGEDGIVIVDDQYAPLADKIQAAMKKPKVIGDPVRAQHRVQGAAERGPPGKWEFDNKGGESRTERLLAVFKYCSLFVGKLAFLQPGLNLVRQRSVLVVHDHDSVFAHGRGNVP